MSDEMRQRPSSTVAKPVVMRPWLVVRLVALLAAAAGLAALGVDPSVVTFGLGAVGVGLTVRAWGVRLELSGGLLRRRGIFGWREPIELADVERVSLHREVLYWRDLPHLVLRLATPDQSELISLRWWQGSSALLAALRIELSAPGATSVSRRIWTIEIDEKSISHLDVI